LWLLARSLLYQKVKPPHTRTECLRMQREFPRPDPTAAARTAPHGLACLAIPPGLRRIMAAEPPAEPIAAEEVRHFVMAMSLIVGFVVLAGAGLLAAG
jgi:hypothetical protein